MILINLVDLEILVNLAILVDMVILVNLVILVVGVMGFQKSMWFIWCSGNKVRCHGRDTHTTEM